MAAKKYKQKPSSSGPRNTAPVTTDPRFSVIHSDPRFAPPKRRDAAVILDSRFRGILSDPKFSSKARIDRYGRRLPKESGKAELSRFYKLDSDAEDEEQEDDGEGEGERRFDPARGEGVIDTSSSEESDSEEVEVEMEGGVEVEDQTEVPTGEVSKRLACVNLDWDNVRAVDLMKAFASFALRGGKVVRVTVYPSEFGRQRMEREELEGPPREIFRKDSLDVGDEVDDGDVTEQTIVKEDKGEEFDSAKLRKYQLERLRYYYAVVECDSERTAQHIYENCDGAEYEATANFFDLRFIPEETSFEDDKPRDECAQDPSDYTPAEFVTDALQHSKVRLTWDEDDAQRKLVAKKAFSQRDIEETELKAYLASDSDSDIADKDKVAEKYRALLGGLTFGGKTKNEPTGEMEVTFTSGLEEGDKGGKVLELEETTIEKYRRKEKERREARKAKTRAARADPTTDNSEKKAASEPEPQEPARAAVDMGFEDPFFAQPAQSKATLKKAEKQKHHEEKAKEAAEKASKRAELELLMADDDNILGHDGKKLSHFDMKQIVKAEKQKKVKKSRAKRGLLEPEGLQEDFKMDVKDPRFAAVFERHDFAIDPTNPRFVKTEGTKKLMEERRKRSAARDGGAGPDEEDGRERKRKKMGKKEELQNLVQSLKKKSKTAAKA